MARQKPTDPVSPSSEKSDKIDRDELLGALGPVLDWYQSDEEPDRDVLDIVRDAVADLIADRRAVLALQAAYRTGRNEPLVRAYEASMFSRKG